MIKLKPATMFSEVLKEHPKAVKKAMKKLDMICLECTGVTRESLSQIAVNSGLDVDSFVGLLESSINNQKADT